MSTLSSANITDVNLVLKERTQMRLCINMLIFTHNLGNSPIARLSHSHSLTIVTARKTKQVAQLSQRDRAAGWVSNGQKWKTGTDRQYLRTI